MNGIVEVGGYDRKNNWTRLATPRASISVNVYGLFVDVFVLGPLKDTSVINE